MENGDEFAAFLQKTQQYLAGLQVVSYYAADLPSEPDEHLAQIVDRFMASDEEKRGRFLAGLNDSERSLFGIYGHRAATLAARNKSREQLLSGLVGASIANVIIPEKRRVDVALAVFYHVARKLDLNPIDLFEDTAVFAADDFAHHLLAFVRQPYITLRRYGWTELKTPEGVKYRFNY